MTDELESHLDYEDYLYRSISEKTPFVIYEEELKRLNDYLVFLLESSNQQKHEEVSSFNTMTIDDDFLVGAGEIELARDEIELSWSFNIEKTLFSLGLTLLLSFLESCLMDLVSWIEPSIKKRKIKGNKIEEYLTVLNNSMNTNLFLSETLINSRRLRNKFVHNQFKYDSVQEKDLRYTIDAIVDLLFDIEDAFIKNGKI